MSEAKEVTVNPVKKADPWVNGNKPNRGGRPKGALSINSQAAVKKLEELGFNPLEKLVEQYEDICRQIDEMKVGTRRYSSMALSQLETLKKGISDTLMRYSYKPVPTTSEQVVENKTPLKITLEGID
jgi:hypothetical protein